MKARLGKQGLLFCKNKQKAFDYFAFGLSG